MHANLVHVAASQGGVFTAAQAYAAGYSRDEVRARLDSGRWARMRRGIYRERGDVDLTAAGTAAAVLACRSGSAAASHRSAAYLHGLSLLESLTLVDITLPSRLPTVRVKGCVVHHASLDGDVVRIGGIPTTEPARTVIDLAGHLSFREAVVVADSALASRRTSTAALNEAAKRVRGRNGSGALNRLLDFASPRAGSPGESLARVVFAEHGLPAPLLGEPIVVDGELLGVVDFLWPSHATVAEFDGRAKYRPTNDRGEDVLWQEKLREERLREAGFEVVRLTWQQVTKQPRETADRVRAAFGRAARSCVVR